MGMQFFGYELGVKTSYTNKESEGERAIVNGHHDTQVFQSLVDKFIEKYVLCRGCQLPEIDMVVNKRALWWLLARLVDGVVNWTMITSWPLTSQSILPAQGLDLMLKRARARRRRKKREGPKLRRMRMRSRMMM